MGPVQRCATLELESRLITRSPHLLQGLREHMRPLVKDTVHLLWEAVRSGDKRILIEGANAQMLDIDFGTVWLFLCLDRAAVSPTTRDRVGRDVFRFLSLL